MDADEAIAVAEHELLRTLLREAQGARKAFSFVTRNYIYQVNAEGWVANDGRYPREEAGSGWIPSEKVRLFPNNDRIRFENPVHELLETSLHKAGIPISKCAVPVHHYGKLDQEREREKREQYYHLGMKKLEEIGEDPTALAELAIQAGELRRFDETIALWKRYLRIVPRNASAFLNLGHAYMEQGDFAQGLAANRKALEIKPDFRDADYNCAICQVFTGRADKAIDRLTRLLQKHPDYPSAMAMLAVAYGCTGDHRKVRDCLARLRKFNIDSTTYVLREARKLSAEGMSEGAVTLLEAAAEEGSESDEIVQLLAEYRDQGDSQCPVSRAASSP
jgi:tetratricopeptide (TPR) repeat protein